MPPGRLVGESNHKKYLFVPWRSMGKTQSVAANIERRPKIWTQGVKLLGSPPMDVPKRKNPAGFD